MPLEDIAEILGFGNTVGLGQMTVGKFGVRNDLLNRVKNIKAMAAHLSELRSTNSSIMTATKYNCYDCSSPTYYGVRVMRYKANFDDGTW